MKSKRWLMIAFIGFFISRLIILRFPPPFYSDVFHDYRRYVEMWQSGLTPYFKHFYEYPPATIPLLYFPQILNQLNIGHFYQNYRGEVFFIDLVLFTFIVKAARPLGVIFYLLAPLIAKDFFYEGIDWFFIGSLTLAIIYFSRRLLFWIFFWLSTGIKFLTAPLAAVFLKKDLKLCLLGFLLVWGLPLVIFRSSLSVMYVFHQQRAIKYASFPGFVVETINYFTHTETRVDKPPDFQLQGPVSQAAEKAVNIIFPLSILLVLIYAWHLPRTPQAAIKISLIYFLTIFFTGKIFSQPFHLWLVPLISLFPFKSIKRQLLFMGLVLLLLVVDTTPWIKLNEQLMVLPPLPLKFFSYLLLRYLPLAALLWLSVKLPSRS